MLGLLKDDMQWHKAMAEAVSFQMLYQLRRMFAIILTHCNPANPLQLWTDHKSGMIEVYMLHFTYDESIEQCLRELTLLLAYNGKCLFDYKIPMPNTTIGIDNSMGNYNVHGHELTAELRGMLNTQRSAIFKSVIDVVMSPMTSKSKVFYLDGPGGSGKTFTYNYLVAELSGYGYTVATSAWTSIAATLLNGFRTVHSMFKLPVTLLDNSSCNITPTSNYAAMLRNVSLFIVDEASMVPLHAFNVIDRLLRDITGIDTSFGGKPFLWGSDFRQVLPVIRHGYPSLIL